jgi:hypothetical protein
MHIHNQLQAAGLSITLAGDKHRYGPKHLLTDELRALMLEHKPAIIAELRREGPPYPDDKGRVTCFYCKRFKSGRCFIGCESDGLALLRDCDAFSPAGSEGTSHADYH